MKPAMTLLFGITIFLSSTLLFLIQPMVSKMILPYFGGTPSVWTACMLFFQIFLLGGYYYAHLINEKFSPRVQVFVHTVLLLAGGIFLPVYFSRNLSGSLAESFSPVFGLMVLLAVGIGVPFLILSASSPLIQRWFSRTSHASARDPYFLYASSNTGSLLALLCYPLAIEPLSSLSQQSRIWTGGYILLILFFILTGVITWKSGRGSGNVFGTASPESVDGAETISLKRKMMWVILAFVPSSLMLGVTTHLTTDIASVPLLWVVPLALYLLTFIFCFARRQVIPQAVMGKIFPITAVVIVFVMLTEIDRPLWLVFFLYLLFFFVAAMVCHGQLAHDRPSPRYLTAYYLLISAGGALGGIFNAILAPVLFNRVIELPLVLVLACLVYMKQSRRQWSRKLFAADAGFAVMTGGIAALLGLVVRQTSMEPYQLWMIVVFGIPLFVSYLFVKRPVRFALAIGAIFLAGSLFPDIYGKVLKSERNFFGCLQVTTDASGPFHRLFYGTTQHGLQFVTPERSREPLAYYHRTGPFGEIFRAYRTKPDCRSVGVIGLGIGSMLAYSTPGQYWTFYEIDPAVICIARDSRYFTYCRDAEAARIDIIPGDARLNLEKALPESFSLLVVDAFNSDAIPVHLITLEAFRLYESKLAAGGMLAINLTNKNLDLRKVIADIAGQLNLFCVFRLDGEVNPDDDATRGKFRSLWAVLVRQPADLGPIIRGQDWRVLPADLNRRPWTDDFSNIVSVLNWF